MTAGDAGGLLTLPGDLERAIAALLAHAPPARWQHAARALSARYRALRQDDGRALASGERDVLGYLAQFVPATYAQLRGAMQAVARRIPGWQPATLLDLGSGPGTALWAATACWPVLQRAVAHERENAFIAVGRALCRSAPHPAVRDARWSAGDIRATVERHAAPSDLVVIGHVLGEIAPDERVALLTNAWMRCSGVLLVVEPGTPDGFAVVRAARATLVGLAGVTLAPCPHDQPCPLQDDWCHAPQRIMRPAFQRAARAASGQWEENKFSYCAIGRMPGTQPVWARVLREPTWNKVYAQVELCTRDGIAQPRGLKRDRAAFRAIKDLAWGAALADAAALLPPDDA
jgi:ribosomal protein RSM22 (predicted rRNA methylase)